MSVQDVITLLTDFFKSIPWENVLNSFKNSIAGINWDSLASLFDWLDFSDGPLQKMIDAILGIFG